MGSDLGEHENTEPLEVLNALAREARSHVADTSASERSDGWMRVSTRMRQEAGRRKVLLGCSVGALTTAAVVGLFVLIPTAHFERNAATAALAYQIHGGSVSDGGYLREAGTDGITLRFGEGTEMAFKAGTRGRLRSVSKVGARIAIEQGQASFRVTPRNDADWSVEVGPFLVAVKGTVFTVTWDARTERLDLILEHGLVSVSGPISSGAVLLKGGQRLSVDLPRKSTLITEANPDGTWPEESPLERPGAAEGQDPDEARPTAFTRAVRRGRDAPSKASEGWGEAVASGNWDRILADADSAGIARTLSHASSDDLLALADAARYRRRADLARAALLAQRRRFSGSASAVDAAYLLGRLAESGGGFDEALRWYDTYLDGAPAGTYASEALGRKMMVSHRLFGVASARPLAQDYLRRFARDSYAGAARALLSSSP